MGEFRIEVIQIGSVEKHPNADSLSMTMAYGGYPVIFQTGTYQPGDLAVYVPVDAVVPEGDERWAFLGKHRRIKAKRLRGVFSVGLLTPAESDWVVGQDVREALRIEKYDPERALELLGTKSARMGLDSEHPQGTAGQLPVYDVEGLRRYQTLLQDSEEVHLTEKVHGCNMRLIHDGDRLWVGSRTRWLRERYADDSGADVENASAWWRVARKYDMAAKLAKVPGIAVFGEVYGQVQDLHYGVPADEGVRFVAFDALDAKTSRYLDVDDFLALMARLELPTAPTLYRGPWTPELTSYAEGPSVIPGANHVREGFVAKPVKDRVELRFGRVILKLAGEGYLLRKTA